MSIPQQTNQPADAGAAPAQPGLIETNQPAAQSPAADAGTVIPIAGEPQSFSNFPADPTERWQLMSAAQNGECRGISDVLNEPFELLFWHAHHVTIADEDGEPLDAWRCVLFPADDALPIACVSDGVMRGLNTLIDCLGPGPWGEPPRVILRQIETRARRRFYTLSAAPKSFEPASGKKSGRK